ncbi:MAG: xanthine dehydrogenase family protein molybdopterin-binding subunit [Chloroflexi bacterium]|nr:xanthine dehydrogenase family protein molybdopterin-binding subunit [Chloroflexota bacterium]
MTERSTTERSTTERSAVGKPITRVEGTHKVTGQSMYVDDLQLPGMLHCKLLRSPYAHARIQCIETAKASALAGVERVITAAELPKFDPKRLSSRAYSLLADDEVVFYGEPVAAVLADDLATAEEALDLIDVTYEELPLVLDPIDAMREDSPLARKPISEIDRSEAEGHVTVDVKEEKTSKHSNVGSQVRFSRGDIEQGFAEADVVIERTWRSAMMHQGYIEPHATIADYDAASGELTVWSATQGQFHVRDQLAKMLKIPETKLRVIGMELGGGFGGKIFLTQALVAALARIVGRPVKLIFTRADDLVGATPSPQCVVELKTGMRKDGSLTAIQAKAVYNSGAFPGGVATVIGGILIGGYYRFPNLEIEVYEVVTNKVSVGALRAPGAHNVTFAIESQVDMMARELKLDPLEVRLQNAVVEGDEMPSKTPYTRIGLRECLEAVRESEIWRSRDAQHESNGKRRGIGLAVGGWLGGLQPASATVELNGDGTINVVVGSNDITGTNTSFAQIAAEELGLPLEMVNVTTADTKTAPFAGMSAGSKTLFTVGRAVKAAAEDAREQIFSVAAERLGASPEELESQGGEVRVKGSPEKSLAFRRLAGITTGFGAIYPPIIGRGAISARRQAPGFTAQVAEVEVDPDTGNVTLLRWAIAQDAGFAINPLSVAGQMQGGSTQGMGIGLWEEMLYDDQGRLLNPGLLDYRMPTALDVPQIETLIVEVPSEDGPYGARGVGEPSIIPGPAAIANAIEDAVGARVTEVPITPERILRALGKI